MVGLVPGAGRRRQPFHTVTRCCLARHSARVRTRVKGCLHTPHFTAVRCSHDSLELQHVSVHLSSPQLVRPGLLISRAWVRVPPGPSRFAGFSSPGTSRDVRRRVKTEPGHVLDGRFWLVAHVPRLGGHGIFGPLRGELATEQLFISRCFSGQSSQEPEIARAVRAAAASLRRSRPGGGLYRSPRHRPVFALRVRDSGPAHSDNRMRARGA